MPSKVKIVEDYYNYFPPVHVYGVLQSLLRCVPEEYLVGLHKITLTNSEQLQNRFRGKITSENERIRPSDCQGLYGDGHIRLIMDRLLQCYPEIFLLVPLFKAICIGEVLYHEIGHHIHQLEEPGYRDRREEVADEWRDKLMDIFVRQRYWYLAAILTFFAPLLRPLVAKLQCALGEEEAS